MRLARPAVITFAAIAAGFGAASLLGVPTQLLAEVGFRMGQPMWFLGVYLGVSALVPIMVRLHESAPIRTIAALCAAALMIDLVRFGTGIEGIGFLNLVFVWLAIQQLGFCYADGWFRRIDRRLLPIAIAASLGLLIMIIGYGNYSPNLIDNLNPPTVCLILLGLAQAFALTLATPALERCAARPVISSIVDAINTRAMTIYLWHMSVLVTVALIMLVVGMPFPEPLSAGWWFSRGYWLIAIAVGMIMAAQALGRYERGAGRAAIRITDSLPKMITAVLIAIAAVVAVLIAGFSVVSATLAALGLATAIRLAQRPSTGSGTLDRLWERSTGSGRWMSRRDQPGLVRGHHQLSPVA